MNVAYHPLLLYKHKTANLTYLFIIIFEIGTHTGGL